MDPSKLQPIAAPKQRSFDPAALQQLKVTDGQSPREAQLQAIMRNIESDELSRKLEFNEKLSPKHYAHNYPMAREKLANQEFSKEDALNPFIVDITDTPAYVFGDATPEERAQLEEKFKGSLYRKGYDVLTGEWKEFFDPHGGSPGSNRNKKLIQKELQRLRNPYMVQLAEETSPGEAALVSIGRGLNTIGRGVGVVDMPDEAEEKGYNLLKGENPAMSIGEVVGESAPFMLPAMGVGKIASTGGRMAGGTALGASQGGVTAKGLGGDDDAVLKSTLLGAGVGLAFESALPLVNLVVKKIASRGRVDVPLDRLRLDAEGTPTPELQAWLDSQNMTVDDLVNSVNNGFSNPLMNAERERAFDELGLRITEAQRSRDPDLFAQQNKAEYEGGAVSDVLRQQEAGIAGAVERQAVETGGVASSNQTLRQAAVDKAEALDNEINRLYNVAREQAPTESIISPVATRNYLDRVRTASESLNNVPGSLIAEMRKLGVLDANMNPVGRLTIQQAEELRQFANRLYKEGNREINAVVREFKDSLDDDVFRSVDNNAGAQAGQNLFVQARTAKREFEQSLSRKPLDRFDRNKTAIVRDIIDNKGNIENLSKRLISGNYTKDDLADLKNYLTTGTEAQIVAGQQAWDDLRRDAIEFIQERAFTGRAGITGNKSISSSALDKALKDIGEGKMAVLFSQAERDFINNLRTVASGVEVPKGAKAYTADTAAVELSKRLDIPGMNWFIELFRKAAERRSAKFTEKQLLKIQDDLKNIAAQNAQIKQNRLRNKLIYTPTTNAAKDIMRSLPSPTMMELVKPEEEIE